jgi:radical SAM protein with 4Fe4S-binding SPASM domain
VRNDIWKLLDHARSRGLKTALSSNGTLITKNVAKKIKDLEVEYVGISLDGANEKIHDAIRNQPGSFRKSVRALKNCVEAGLKCGIRMTITKDNYHEVSRLLSLAIRLGVPRFCIYWLVPSGRGRQLYSSKRLGNEEVTKVLDLLYMKAKEFNSSCLEILTVDAPQDGVYILNKLMEESSPEYKNALKLLEYMGDACSAGERIANVDSAGNVYPCQFAQLEELKIGNIRQRKFSEIWSDSENPMLSAFRNKTAHLKGKCSLCAYKELCKGGCRIRAYIEYGDIWAEDPLCANS